MLSVPSYQIILRAFPIRFLSPPPCPSHAVRETPIMRVNPSDDRGGGRPRGSWISAVADTLTLPRFRRSGISRGFIYARAAV